MTARVGHGASSRTGAPRSNGSASGRTRKFAEMIDHHWAGIAASCKPDNKVSLGFVEGLNNKIRMIQRRSYGLRDEEYLPQNPHVHAAGSLNDHELPTTS
jgi:hypothetical protein